MTPAPTSPPTSACEDDDGNPHHHVARFHVTAARSEANKIPNVSADPTLMRPPTVSATAVPARIGPTSVKTAATAIAVPGRIARVATGAATEFDESWNPLVTSNATASTTTRTSAATPPPLTKAVSRGQAPDPNRQIKSALKFTYQQV